MSRLPFELLLALRYLRPKRTFVSIITFISVVGVALGVAVLIIVISVMSGFDQQMRDTILGFNAHLQVQDQSRAPLTNYPAILSLVASNPHVRGVAPLVLGQVMLETEPETGPSLVFAPYLRGVDPHAETNVSVLPNSIVEGQFDLGGHGLVIGSSLASNLKLRVGDRVAIYSPRELKKMKENRGKESEQAVLPDDYEVRGIFQVGYYEFDATVIVASLENAQEMYALDGGVHDLMVMLRDPLKVTTVQGQLAQTLGPRFRVMTWLEQSPLLAAVMVEKNVMLYILFFIVLVAAFGITCTLITFIVMKTREIGLMKALGASNRQVMWVFMGQSLVVSLLGVLTGVAVGLLALHYRNEFLEFMRVSTGLELFPASIYNFSQLPAKVVPGDILIICGGSLLICLLAAAFPARYASRLNPVEALRYE
jgi:lipoprotein-releasing system permease protein